MQPPIPSAGQISPDGMWRWDGQRWAPTGASPRPAYPVPAPPWLSTPYATSTAAVSERRSALAVSGAITAALGTPLILAGCIVPFVYWNDKSNGATSSIFDLGSPNGFWYAIEPVAVMVFVLVAAVMAIALPGKVARAIAGGLLVALGAQTMAMFVGYTFGDLSFGRTGAGGPLGALGGLLVFTGGGMCVGSLFSRA